VDHPNVVADLQRIDDPEGIPRYRSASSITPEPRLVCGWAMSGIRPSARMVSARATSTCAPCGKSSKSFLAPLSQLIGSRPLPDGPRTCQKCPVAQESFP
jgi:hypothetical protein